MAGEKDLAALLRAMNPELKKGAYVFCAVSPNKLHELKPLLVFREDEGTTVILNKKDADGVRLPYESEWVLITLNVLSSLEAIGFLARISGALAEAGISINVVSAYYHDHLFVPAGKEAEALAVLKRLSANP